MNQQEYTGDYLADEHDGDQMEILDLMQSDASLRLARGGHIEVVDDHFGLGEGLEGRLKYEQFMQDPIVVKIHKSGDKNASPCVPVGINGDQKWLPRGIPIRIPRCFVERLAQCQATAYRTVENKDPESDNGMLAKATTSHDFPFDVIHDPSRFGARWLRHMMKQG